MATVRGWIITELSGRSSLNRTAHATVSAEQYWENTLQQTWSPEMTGIFNKSRLDIKDCKISGGEARAHRAQRARVSFFYVFDMVYSCNSVNPARAPARGVTKDSAYRDLHYNHLIPLLKGRSGNNLYEEMFALSLYMIIVWRFTTPTVSSSKYSHCA